MKIIAVVILLCASALAACSGSSPNWTSTPDSTSVQTCVTNATAGDTITLSGGSATYSSTVSIGKALTIIVALGSTVTITRSASGVSAFTITGTGLGSSDTDTSSIVRISGNTPATDNCKSNGTTCGLIINGPLDSTFNDAAITVRGPAKIRFDHINANQGDAFLYANVNDVPATGRVEGVIDHSYFTNFGRTHFYQDQRSADSGTSCDGDNNGLTSWTEYLASPSALAGSAKLIYWEDDHFTLNESLPAGSAQGTFYGQYGGRIAVRNSISDGYSVFFVDEGEGPGCGSTYMEVYNNTFNEGTTFMSGVGKQFDDRSGQKLIHDNAFVGADIPWMLISYPNGHTNTAHDPHNSFFWNNTWNGTACPATVFPASGSCAEVDPSSQTAGKPVFNTDFFLRAPTTGDAFAGYTPLTYPHPYIGGGSNSATSLNGLHVPKTVRRGTAR